MSTPSRRFTTTTTGEYNQAPVAVLATTKIDTLIGAIIQLDGRQSYDPERQPLTFKWRFSQIPIGSEVETAGFTDLRPNSTAVSFVPDKTGVYIVELIVNDGELDSQPVTCTVNIQLSRVPCGENIIPDAHFMWSYLSDFWKLVEDRERITSIWSSVIQLIGTDLIKLWGADYNKSLETIQETYQRRWQRFSMLTDTYDETDQRIIVGKNDSGVNGSSGTPGQVPGTGTTSSFFVPKGNVGDGDKTDFTVLEGNYGSKGRVIVINGVTYTISRTSNQRLRVASGSSLVTNAGTNEVDDTSADFESDGVSVGDLFVISAGDDIGTYRVKEVTSATHLVLVYVNDPPAGPVPSFIGTTDQDYAVDREVTSVTVNEETIPDGIIGAEWRVPHLLHIPEYDLEAEGVRAGDVLVFEARRGDTGLTTEVFAQVVGAHGDRVGFELSTTELDPSVNEGSGASVVESGGIITVSGLTNMRPTSVGGYIELLNGDTPGKYRILSYVSEDAVTIDNTLASGADSANPEVQWVERGKVGTNLERDFFRKIVRDLRLVPAQSSDIEVAAAAETLIRFVPPAINLNTRPFSKFGITLTAKRIIHNTAIKVDDNLVSAPVLQESIIDPPVALRENLDYIVEDGYIQFVGELFSLASPAPDEFWAECAIYDNSDVVEGNFGRLVGLSQDDISDSRTSAPYLSAVKGLFFAYTNGPTMANLRLGLQILLGLPFSEERGLILEVQDNFTYDSSGNLLGRILIEDLDDNNKRLGFRRVYLYSTEVGIEDNPSTLEPYKAGDVAERFAPLSKGVEVIDYVKDPLWWQRTLQGLEVLKFFTFKIAVSSKIFNSEDVIFGLDFIKKIKPAYTRVLAAALFERYDDIELEEILGGSYLTKFYDNNWGLEATKRAGDRNHQGAILWNAGSFPFSTRSLYLLTDVRTFRVGSEVHAQSSLIDTTLLQVRDPNPGTPIDRPTVEGDILVILQDQPGSSIGSPSYWEIDSIVSSDTVKLRSAATMTDSDSLDTPLLDPDLFVYGEDLMCSILRRSSNPTLIGVDLVTTAGEIVAESASAQFLKNLAEPGYNLVIELGDNKGEYVIDALPLPKGTTGGADFDAGTFAVPSGDPFDPSVIGKTLVLKDNTGVHLGAYKITSYSDPNQVGFSNPRGTTGVAVIGDWFVEAEAPYISDTQVALKNWDGTPAVLSSGTDQAFRVVHPAMYPGIVYGAKSIFNAVDGWIELEVYDLGTGDPRDVFTPGMVGLTISVSESDNPVNDGIHLITGYINSGRVILDSSSITSDTAAVSKINFMGAP